MCQRHSLHLHAANCPSEISEGRRFMWAILRANRIYRAAVVPERTHVDLLAAITHSVTTGHDPAVCVRFWRRRATRLTEYQTSVVNTKFLRGTALPEAFPIHRPVGFEDPLANCILSACVPLTKYVTKPP
jgi:hypothetical protein